MNNLPTALTADLDPARLGYPVTLPIELALRMKPVQDICEAYGVSQSEWAALCQDEVFKEDLRRRIIEVREDGVSFKMKAGLQGEEYLKKIWEMVHGGESVPAAVKADLMKFVIRAAGQDGSKDQAQNSATMANALQINIHL